MEPDLRYRTAWRRVWAGLADGLVFLPLGWMDRLIWTVTTTLFVLVSWHVCFSMSMVAYNVLCHWKWGQTLGKRLTGVRVESLSGGALSLRQAAMRDILPLVLNTVGVLLDLPRVTQCADPYRDAASAGIAGFSPFQLLVLWSSLLWFVLEVLTMLSNSKRRALHDMIAGTVVVRTELASMAKRLTTG